MIQSSDVLQAMQWRYACKKFDSTKKVPEDIVDDLLKILNLTATSLGMQLLKVIVIRDQEIKKQLLPCAYNQHQVVDCSHLLVLCRYNHVDENLVDEYVNRSASTREMDVNSPKIQGFKNMVMSTVSMADEKKVQWMTNQVYIALGNLLTSCAMVHVDSCPMEGFDPAKVDEVLKLQDYGLSSVLLCPLGYRHEEDVYSKFAKVRRPISDFIIEI